MNQQLTDAEIELSIQHLTSMKQAMKEGKIAKSDKDMKGNLPKLMFTERTADELMQAMLTIKHYKSQVEEMQKTLERVVGGLYGREDMMKFASQTLQSLKGDKP